jgi:hypothetical protein
MLLNLLITRNVYVHAAGEEIEREDERQRERIYKLYLNQTHYINNWDLLTRRSYSFLSATFSLTTSKLR